MKELYRRWFKRGRIICVQYEGDSFINSDIGKWFYKFLMEYGDVIAVWRLKK